MTSSKSSSAPSRVAIARRPWRKPGFRRDDAHVRRDRLHDDDGDAARVRGKEPADRVEVVVPRRDREAGERGGDAGRAGDAERRDAGARRDEERVRVPVVAARELQDEVAARGGAREAHGAHRGLRPRGHEAHLLHRRQRHRDALGQLDLAARGRAVRRAAGQGASHGGGDGRRGVPEEERPVGHDVVHVAVAVRVDQRGAAAPSSRRTASRPRTRTSAPGDDTPPGMRFFARAKRASDRDVPAKMLSHQASHSAASFA